jgi:secondary thiamine-phosphate synthase enzyme
MAAEIGSSVVQGKVAMVFYHEIPITTRKRCEWVDITPDVRRIIASSSIKRGICLVASLHTTGGITINENADPDVERDFFWKLDMLIPRDDAYRHGEGNSDSHVKTSLVGLSVHVCINEGQPVLGTWQSIYFCECDGGRQRRVAVSIVGE